MQNNRRLDTSLEQYEVRSPLEHTTLHSKYIAEKTTKCFPKQGSPPLYHRPLYSEVYSKRKQETTIAGEVQTSLSLSFAFSLTRKTWGGIASLTTSNEIFSWEWHHFSLPRLEGACISKDKLTALFYVRISHGHENGKGNTKFHRQVEKPAISKHNNLINFKSFRRVLDKGISQITGLPTANPLLW